MTCAGAGVFCWRVVDDGGAVRSAKTSHCLASGAALEHGAATDRDTKGDLYEYTLGKIASAGQNGQFRTPRHIIQLMVEMTAPRATRQPTDTECRDPVVPRIGRASPNRCFQPILKPLAAAPRCRLDP